MRAHRQREKQMTDRFHSMISSSLTSLSVVGDGRGVKWLLVDIAVFSIFLDEIFFDLFVSIIHCAFWWNESRISSKQTFFTIGDESISDVGRCCPSTCPIEVFRLFNHCFMMDDRTPIRRVMRAFESRQTFTKHFVFTLKQTTQTHIHSRSWSWWSIDLLVRAVFRSDHAQLRRNCFSMIAPTYWSATEMWTTSVVDVHVLMTLSLSMRAFVGYLPVWEIDSKRRTTRHGDDRAQLRKQSESF